MFIKNTIWALLLGVAIASPFSVPEPSVNGSYEEEPTIFRRVAKSPLDVPAGSTSADAVKFMKAQIAKVKGDNDIGIVPSQNQLAKWQIASGSASSGVAIPISATSLWYDFKNTPQTYKMSGLTGCTATIMLTPYGITERDDNDFQKIALDIMSTDTPAAEKNNRAFVSLSDMKKINDDIWEPPVAIFVLTKGVVKAKKLTTKPVYETKVKNLEKKYKSVIRKAKIEEKTYIGDTTLLPADFPTDVSGVIVIQYTPYQELKNGKQGAMARVYYENNPTAAAFIEWEAMASQK